MSESRIELLRWQFDLTWSLFELHLDELRDEEFLAEPAEHCWTMRQDSGRGWFPDWADVEPDPVPLPTVAWLTWHIGWWWTATLDHVAGRPADRAEVAWPGPGAPTIAWLRDLHEQWLATLAGMTDEYLDSPASFPWQDDDPDKTVAHTVAWVNAELMKNVAEIGQLRRL